MEAGFPDTSSEFADEGTAAHFLASECLEGEHDAKYFLGRQIEVGQDTGWATNARERGAAIFTADADMCREVQKYLDAVRAAAEGGTLHVEQRLPIFGGAIPDQFGTSDTVIELPRMLWIRDLKYGRGVQVYAEENEQLMLYALGALDEFDLLGEVETVRMSIDQPRLNHSDTWECGVEHLRAFEQRAIAAGKRAFKAIEIGGVNPAASLHQTGALNPGPNQCRFCKAKATCPALMDKVLADVAGDFEDLGEEVFDEGGKSLGHLPPSEPVVDRLVALGKGEIAVSIIDAEKIIAAAHGVAPGKVDFYVREDTYEGIIQHSFIVKKPTLRPMLENPEARLTSASDKQLGLLGEAIDLVEGWAKAVRAELERRMLAGGTVPGFKLVKGREGIRKWSDEIEAEKMCKTFRLKHDEMYDSTLKSPTSMEKAAADGIIGKKQWPKLQALITRSEAGLSVAPASDKRPAVEVGKVEDDFEVLPENTDDLSDLL
jgi:hypothetical protein